MHRSWAVIFEGVRILAWITGGRERVVLKHLNCSVTKGAHMLRILACKSSYCTGGGISWIDSCVIGGRLEVIIGLG
jgi:hypothetical protein